MKKIEKIKVDRIFQQPHQKIELCFWDIKGWSGIWNYIEKVSLLYQDGIIQEFVMVVERDGLIENIRTIRFKYGNVIEFFSPSPPPMMENHSGKWIFEKIDTKKTKVIALREYKLLQKENETTSDYLKRSHQFKLKFQKRLSQILETFDKYMMTH
ncbi:MAG: hypothetical protein ACMUIU_09660 [bacterium]